MKIGKRFFYIFLSFFTFLIVFKAPLLAIEASDYNQLMEGEIVSLAEQRTTPLEDGTKQVYKKFKVLITRGELVGKRLRPPGLPVHDGRRASLDRHLAARPLGPPNPVLHPVQPAGAPGTVGLPARAVPGPCGR